MKREQLRLRMERALIEKAKRFAREHGISVSSMVADFFDGLKRTRSPGQRYGPITRHLSRSLKAKEGEPWSTDKRATCGTLKRSMGMNAFFDTNVVLHALLGREL